MDEEVCDSCRALSFQGLERSARRPLQITMKELSMAESPALRPLGAIENLFSAYSEVGAMAFALVAEIEHPIEQATLTGALAEVQALHALLQVCIGPDDDGRLSFIRREGPVSLAMRQASALSLDEEIARDLEDPFPSSEGSLMRVTALSRGEATSLICTFHHAATDAKGALVILMQLLGAIAGNRPSGSAEFQSLDRYVGYATPDFVRIPDRALDYPRSLTVESAHLSSEATASLLAVARRGGVTFNSLLVAAVAEARLQLRRDAFRIMTPVDVRPLFDTSTVDGLFLSIAITAREEAEDMWDHARRIAGGIAAARNPKSVGGFVSAIGGRFALASDYAQLRDLMVANPPYDAIVTNLGSIFSDEDDEHGRPKRVFGPILKPFPGHDVIAVSSFEGRLTLAQSSAGGDTSMLSTVLSLLDTL